MGTHEFHFGDYGRDLLMMSLVGAGLPEINSAFADGEDVADTEPECH